MRRFPSTLACGLACGLAWVFLVLAPSADAKSGYGTDRGRSGGYEQDQRGRKDVGKRDRREYGQRGKRDRYDRDRKHGKHHGRKHGKHHGHKHDKPEYPDPTPTPSPAPEFAAWEQDSQGPRIGPGIPTNHKWLVPDGMKYDVFSYVDGVGGGFTPESAPAIALVASGAATLDQMDLEVRPSGVVHMTPKADAGDLPVSEWLTIFW